MAVLASPMPTQIKWNLVSVPEIVDTKVHTLMVTGSREYDDLRQMNDVLSRYAEIHKQDFPDVPLVLISGHAQRGADLLAEMLWQDHGPIITVPADWQTHTPSRCKCHDNPTTTYCRLAGIVRNEQMVNDYKPSVVVAFYEPTAANRGTNHAADYARSKDIPVRMVIAADKTPVVVDTPVDTTNPLDF